MKRTLSPTVAMLAAALGACASAPDEGFGDSVRHMIGAQIHDPAAALNPGATPSQGLSGDKAAQAMRAYRSDKPLQAPEASTILLPVQPAP